MEVADIYPNNFIYNTDPTMEEEDNRKYQYYHDYYDLHKQFLTPTSIKIDIDLFEKEIPQYHSQFRHWGNNRRYLPRYALSLVNNTGKINEEIDYASSPLDITNNDKMHEKLFAEKDFNKPTEVFYNLKCLRALDPIKNFLLRSSIVLKHKEGNFMPHTDVKVDPTWNLRILGVSHPENYELGYLVNIVDSNKLEPGIIYLIDTSLTHYSRALDDWLYTFFIAVDNTKEAFEWFRQNLI